MKPPLTPLIGQTQLVGLVGHGDGVNGDLVAEGLEVSHGTGCAFAGVVPGVVVRSWVLVVGAGAEHVPDGGEGCSFDRDDGSEFSAAAAMRRYLAHR
jgi:hypothetical protein